MFKFINIIHSRALLFSLQTCACVVTSQQLFIDRNNHAYSHVHTYISREGEREISGNRGKTATISLIMRAREERHSRIKKRIIRGNA